MPGEDNLLDAVGRSFGISDNSGTQNDQTQDTSSQTNDAQTGNQSDNGDGAGDNNSGAQPSANADRQSQQNAQQQRDGQDNSKDPENRFFDKKKPDRGPNGELLDKDGNVIAATRRERVLAYNLNRAEHNERTVRKQLETARQELQQFADIRAMAQQHNYNAAMIADAIGVRAMFDRDPANAVREIIGRVLATTNLTMEQILGKDAVEGINGSLIRTTIDRQLGPVLQQAQQRQREEAVNRQAVEQLQQFIADHPFADTHGEAIDALVQSHGITPQKAYYELRSWAQANGLDFTQALGPQVDALQARNGGRQQQQQQQRPQHQQRDTRTPGGHRSAPNPGNGTGVEDRQAMNGRDYGASTPWKDIASDVFREINQSRRN